MANKLLLAPKEQFTIIDKALREHYRETMERKRVPNDYVLMFTEGGESDAVADAIARAQARKVITKLRQQIDLLENKSWLTNASQYRKYREADWQRFKRKLQEILKWLKE